MAKWSKIMKGDRIELRGREYEVVKIKAKGSTAKVTVRGGGSIFESKVRLSDKVAIVTTPLHDRGGSQTRWAKPSEVKHRPSRGLSAGDPSVKTPPSKPSADPWETPRDKAERRLGDILGAHLVAETDDETAGYYVPPVDVSTIAAHLVLFHGTAVKEYRIDDMLELHNNEHAAALKGVALKTNHWHTETRPNHD